MRYITIFNFVGFEMNSYVLPILLPVIEFEITGFPKTYSFPPQVSLFSV